MQLNAKNISILGVIQNVFLSAAKLGAGIMTGSMAVLAEGVHSGMDVFSSLVGWWGINKSQKPADKRHPYGHGRYETLASLVVTSLLFLGGAWIIFDAIHAVVSGKHLIQYSFWGIAVMLFSVVLNEIMARLKFKKGNELGSLVLVSDGQHDRADVVASAAVLAGLLVSRWFPLADSLLALGVGAYIIFESVGLAKESVELLVDTANPELEEKISKLLKDEGFEFSDIKTRQIGNDNFAEIQLLCRPDAKVEEVDLLLKKLEKKLLDSFTGLSQVALTVKSHQIEQNAVRPRFWGSFSRKRKWENVGPAKKGFRAIVPISERGDIIFGEFGAPKYLVLDLADGRQAQTEVIANPYYEKGEGHGARFAKSVQADLAAVRQISDNAKNNLAANSIEIMTVDINDDVGNVVQKIKKMKGGDLYA